LDDFTWGKNAKWEFRGKPVFMFKNRQFAIDARMLLIPGPDKKTPKYYDIETLVAGIKSGEYMKDFLALASAELKFKQGRGPKPVLLSLSARKTKRNVGITQADVDAETSDWDDDDGSQQESFSKDSPAVLFSEYGIPSIDNLLREDLSASRLEPLSLEDLHESDGLYEKEFYMRDLSSQEADALYQEFQNSYTKATGAAFTRDAFEWRADNWTFLGDPPNDGNPSAPVGGIAVRRQVSNDMYKLVASFGNFRSVLRGFDELNAKHPNSCVWGFLSPDLIKMVLKHSKLYKTVPGPVVKAMEGMIKKMSNGEVKSVGIDGTLKVDTPAGIMAKKMIGNINYFKWMIDSIEDPRNAGRIPVPQVVLHPLLSLVKALV
jgi:hypothetical protein